MENYLKVKLPLYAKIALTLISLGLFIAFLIMAHGLLVPLAFAFVFSLLLHPLCVRLENWRFPRVLAIFVCLITVTVAVGLILYLISAQIINFGQDLPELQARLNQLIERVQTFVFETFGVERTNQLDLLKQSGQRLIQSSGSFVTSILGAMTNTFADMGLIPIYVFFFLYYRNFFKQFLHKLLADVPPDHIDQVLRKIRSVVKSYILGLLLVISIIATLNTIGLFALGIQYALFFGIFAAFLNIIPYLGIIIGSLLPITMALLTKDSIWYAVGVAGIFTFVQFLEGNFITPNIVGSKVSVNPFIAIVALILGATIWGIPGMILSIPFTAILKVIFDNVPSLVPFGFLLGEPPEPQNENPQGDFVEDIKKEITEKIKVRKPARIPRSPENAGR